MLESKISDKELTFSGTVSNSADGEGMRHFRPIKFDAGFFKGSGAYYSDFRTRISASWHWFGPFAKLNHVKLEWVALRWLCVGGIRLNYCDSSLITTGFGYCRELKVSISELLN